MITERNAYIEYLTKNGLCQSGRTRAIRSVNSSDIKAHGQNIPFSYVPLFINRKDLEFFDGEIQKVQGILNKMTCHYVENPEYRKIFGFSHDMEELICLPCNYEEVIPIGRYDIFYDENTGDYSFCEFNTDGSGGMSRDYEMSRAIMRSCPGFFAQNTDAELLDAQLAKQEDILSQNSNGKCIGTYKCFDTIGKMADTMIWIYFSSENAVENPVFCVTDFREEGVFSDFNRFIRAFEERGITARFTDIRDLVFDGERLYDRTDGQTIHGIYRRAVTSVVLDRLDECQGLISAVRAGKVTLMGHFRTSLVHSKVVFEAMYHPMTRAILTEDEWLYIKKHIPQTHKFISDKMTSRLWQELINNKNDWLIKPEEGFGSHGVVCGMDRTDEEWQRELAKRIDNNDIIQKFCKRYEVPLLGPYDDTITMYPLMLGIYQAAGRAVGFYSRAGREGIIDFDHGGICVSTVEGIKCQD